MGELYTGRRTLDWEGWELDEPTEVNGSVFEFAFGPRDQCYIATSYPYRPQYAKNDVRSIEVQNLPQDIWEQIKQIRPRYIMNIAFRRKTSTWVIYCYRGPGRYAYDSKWRPRKPDPRSEKLGATLDQWKEHECDQVSYCAFGDHRDKWFMRSTNGDTKWYSQLGPGASADLEWYYDSFSEEKVNKTCKNGKVFSASTVRAATFGPGETWILYSQNRFTWSKNGLPCSLVAALKQGHGSKWIINKAVLNPFNRNEYVLVYDGGQVYCSLDPNFQDSFKKIIDEWGNSMLRYKKWTDGRTPVIEWKDPAAVAQEPFVNPGSGEEDAEYFRTGTSTNDPRSQSFSNTPGNQPISGDTRKPNHERQLSNETQASQLSSHSPQSSSSTRMGRGSTEERNPMPVTESNEAGNLPFSARATRQRTVSSAAVTDLSEAELNQQNRVGVIVNSGHRDQPRRSNDNNAPLGLANTPQPAEALGISRAREISHPSRSPSATAPERVEDQELRLRWRSPVPDVQEAVASRLHRTRTEEAQRLRRWDGMKLALRGKVDRPGGE